MVKRKSAESELIINVPASFTDIMEAAKKDSKEAELEVKRLQVLLSTAERLQKEKDKEVNRLKKIDRMAIQTEAPYEWHTKRNEGSSYQKTAWSEYSEYKTAIYDWTIGLKERTDLKKMKWEASVHGWKTTPADKIYNGSEYRDNDYIRNKYSDSTLEGKFPSEAAAREWLKKWQVRLVIDHEEEIIQERALVELAKARPRIKLGSIVEHEFFGRGKVVDHIHGERWTVKFEGSKRYQELLRDKSKELEPRPVEEDSLKLIQE